MFKSPLANFVVAQWEVTKLALSYIGLFAPRSSPLEMSTSPNVFVTS